MDFATKQRLQSTCEGIKERQTGSERVRPRPTIVREKSRDALGVDKAQLVSSGCVPVCQTLETQDGRPLNPKAPKQNAASRGTP